MKKYSTKYNRVVPAAAFSTDHISFYITLIILYLKKQSKSAFQTCPRALHCFRLTMQSAIEITFMPN